MPLATPIVYKNSIGNLSNFTMIKLQDVKDHIISCKLNNSQCEACMLSWYFPDGTEVIGSSCNGESGLQLKYNESWTNYATDGLFTCKCKDNSSAIAVLGIYNDSIYDANSKYMHEFDR